MPTLLETQADLDSALDQLATADPRLAAVRVVAGTPALRRRPAGFGGIAAIVVSQQLSTASASAIWGRLSSFYDPIDHRAMLRARAPRLVRAGLSAAKIKTLRTMAKAIESGHLDLAALADLPADAAHQALLAQHGIGPWTADIYLLFCLGHADAWPAGDLALQEAARIALALPVRPTAREMGPIAEPWRPWRGVAAHLLWAYYRAVKRRDPVPVNPGGTDGG